MRETPIIDSTAHQDALMPGACPTTLAVLIDIASGVFVLALLTYMTVYLILHAVRVCGRLIRGEHERSTRSGT